MLRRLATTGLLLGLVLGLVTTAVAYKYKKPAGRDCGKVSITGGFGGPAPSNVPKNATPQVHTFIVRGKISCAQAKKVMAEFEASFNTPSGGSKGVSPAGWHCDYSKKEGGQECTNSSSHAVVANGIVYKVPKKSKAKGKH